MFQNLRFYIDLYRTMFAYKYCNIFSKDVYNSNQEIPKTIHFAWFGGKEYPELVKKCIESWEKLPGYTIKKWDEHNFPFDEYPFAKKALENKKWAFVSDVARLYAVYTEGGIYMDTDVELLGNFDDMKQVDCFFGIEDKRLLSNAIMGSKKHNPFIQLLLLWYKVISYRSDYVEIANTRICTKLFYLYYKMKIDGNRVDLQDGTTVRESSWLVIRPDIVNRNKMKAQGCCGIHYSRGDWSD